MKGTIVEIQDGCFNDILIIKLENGKVVESRGFDIGLKGVPLVKPGQTVSCEVYFNDLAKKEFVRRIW